MKLTDNVHCDDRNSGALIFVVHSTPVQAGVAFFNRHQIKVRCGGKGGFC